MNLIEKEEQIAALEKQLQQSDAQDQKQQTVLKNAIEALRIDAYSNLSAWDTVCMARHKNRPKASDFVEALFPDFMELHGDRCYGDDGSCMAGLASFHGIPVTVLAQRKGKTLEENMQYNFGMLHPEGYRKAIRLAKEAQRFNRAVILFVDTAGAYPGKGAEERGQAQAIAQCLEVFATLKTPVISIVVSEGGSGGALAFTLADHIFMLENAIYSILSPEGFASILWKDETRVQEAAQVMELRSIDLLNKGIIDEIIPEPFGGIQQSLLPSIEELDKRIWKVLQELRKQKEDLLLENRYHKFRSLGAAYELM